MLVVQVILKISRYIFSKCLFVLFFHIETEEWFIDSFEEWRKAKNLSNFVLLGHSFGGYVAAKYALKVYSLILI